MKETNKLYRVTLRGMTFASIGVSYGVSYVVSKSCDEAYDKVKKYLDENKIGYSCDRELDKIELIAEEERYTQTGTMLYL